MKLITQNLLMCNSHGCAGRNRQLQIQASEVNQGTLEYNQSLTDRMIEKLDWSTFTNVAASLGHSLPDSITTEDRQNSELLQRIFNILFNIDVHSGSLTCQECSRVYPIENGIPNLLSP